VVAAFSGGSLRDVQRSAFQRFALFAPVNEEECRSALLNTMHVGIHIHLSSSTSNFHVNYTIKNYDEL
jgi:hypothetical protein